MTMRLDLRKENGDVIESETSRAWELGAALPGYDAVDDPYLRLVDPYSDTWFSSYQMVAVIPELERLAAEKPLLSTKRALELARKCREGIGLYIVFRGD